MVCSKNACCAVKLLTVQLISHCTVKAGDDTHCTVNFLSAQYILFSVELTRATKKGSIPGGPSSRVTISSGTDCLCWSSWICFSMFPRTGLVRDRALIPLRPSMIVPALAQNSGLMSCGGPVRMFLCSQTRMSHNVSMPSHVNLLLVAFLFLKLWTPSAAFKEASSAMIGTVFSEY